MEFKNIAIDKKEGITKLIINRPPVNVINFETLIEINHALTELANDKDTRVLLMRGTGNRAFCAGIEVRDHVGEMLPKMMTDFGKMIRLLRSFGKPSIAVVNGMALGGGCEIVAGCDLAVASEKAELGQPEIKLGGLAPAAAALFPRLMSEKRAIEMILVGDSIPAREAERIGLINKVVSEEELDKTAETMARKFLKMSDLSIHLVRDAVYQCAAIPDLFKSIEKATELGIASWITEDGQEGLKAYLEKRSAIWKNK
jgi:cyclohexa-1,5-dienecarbonyl-CoA hydratase